MEAENSAVKDPLTGRIIACAIEVHRELGPGLLESAYEACLCHEFKEHGIAFRSQVDRPVVYKGIHIGCSYRMDLLVEKLVIVELKTVDALLAIHDAQLITYLKLSKLRTGLLLNFHTKILRDGIRRLSL